jgi:hypothetical protein
MISRVPSSLWRTLGRDNCSIIGAVLESLLHGIELEAKHLLLPVYVCEPWLPDSNTNAIFTVNK